MSRSNAALFLRRQDELGILERHELEVSTRGAPDVLTAEREFIAFKGFEGGQRVLLIRSWWRCVLCCQRALRRFLAVARHRSETAVALSVRHSGD